MAEYKAPFINESEHAALKAGGGGGNLSEEEHAVLDHTGIPGTGGGFTDLGSDQYIFSPANSAAIVIDVDSAGAGIIRNNDVSLAVNGVDASVTATAVSGKITLSAEGDGGRVDISASGVGAQMAFQSEDIFIGGPSDSIGFYNQTPVAQQTGVAVSAAAIHAALVALGLITA